MRRGTKTAPSGLTVPQGALVFLTELRFDQNLRRSEGGSTRPRPALGTPEGLPKMVANDLGACEWFVWDLRRSALIDRGPLDQIVGEYLKRHPRAEAPALAEHLVRQGTLTAFQAERVLGGKTAGLVLGPYVLLEAIGTGSMGQVFKATSKNDTSHYAVKVLPRRSMWNVRLARRQVRSFSQFNHPARVCSTAVPSGVNVIWLRYVSTGASRKGLKAERSIVSPAPPMVASPSAGICQIGRRSARAASHTPPSRNATATRPAPASIATSDALMATVRAVDG